MFAAKTLMLAEDLVICCNYSPKISEMTYMLNDKNRRWFLPHKIQSITNFLRKQRLRRPFLRVRVRKDKCDDFHIP